MKPSRLPILPFLFVSILALVMGLWAGLIRLGWTLPAFPSSLAAQHGPLMISGFMGTLIALERVAAIRQRWMLAAPFFSGTGWILSLVFTGSLIGPLAITLGSIFATAIMLVMLKREPKIYILAIAVGVACWLVGNLFWLSGAPIFQIIWIWAAFLVLTVAGERVELSRVLRYRPWQLWVFALSAGIFLTGAFLNTRLPLPGTRLVGVGMLALALWLLRFDIARRNLRHPLALPRFIATCLYSGFIWLGISGLLNLINGPQFAGLRYDAAIHSVLIGFIFSMIFGHALIILPALTQINVPFRRIFYLPLFFLHATLLLRIASDLAGWQSGRMWGGLLNEIAILLFIGLFAAAMIQQIKQPQAPPHPTGSVKPRETGKR